MTGRRGPAARAVDLLAVAVLVASGLVGYGPAFGGTRYLVAGAVGLVLGLLVATGGAVWRWSAVTVAAGGVVAYLVAAGAVAVPDEVVARAVPTLTSTRTVLVAAVHGWKDVVTLTPPVGEHRGVLVVPLLTGLVGALVAGSLVLRARHPWWALLPAGVTFVVPILLGTPDAALPWVQGAVVVVVGTGWAAWRRETYLLAALDDDEPDRAGRAALVRSRLRSGAVMLLVAGVGGAALAPASAAAVARHTLRESVIPPLDLEQYHSPLTGFRSYVKDHDKDVLFTVDGLPAGARVRLATLDGYDGVVYGVTEGGAGAFAPVSGALPGRGPTAHLTFSSQTYSGVWLPDVGDLRAVTFTGPRATTLTRSLFYDAATGVALTTAGLQPGDGYAVSTVLAQTWTDQQLAGRSFANVTMPPTAGVPDAVQATAGRLAGPGTDAITTVRHLTDGLAGTGFFSHGLQGETASRAGHTAERIGALLGADQMVGDDEQYAVAMALMARQLGIPARVVMGFYPPAGAGAGAGPVAITGDDVHAWVEVDFAGAGWVPFDPTPAKDRTVQSTSPKPRSDPKPQVLQPPVPPQVPPELPPDTRQDRGHAKGTQNGHGLLSTVLRVGGIAAIPVLVLVLPLTAVVLAKRRRRQRRATASGAVDRVSGGWFEVLDHATDLGTPVPAGATRRETATALAVHFPEVRLAPLATQADASVFGAGDPSPDEVDRLWAEVDAVLGGMDGSVGRWRRARARFSVRSLRAERARRRTGRNGAAGVRRRWRGARR